MINKDHLKIKNQKHSSYDKSVCSINKMNNWSCEEVKILHKGIKKYGFNSNKIEKNLLKNKSKSEIDEMILIEEIKNEFKVKKSVNNFIKGKNILKLTSSYKIPEKKNSEILPLEYYLSDFF